MGDHRVAVIETDDEEFSMTPHSVHLASGEPGNDLLFGRIVPNCPIMVYGYFGECSAAHCRLQMTTGGLNFG